MPPPSPSWTCTVEQAGRTWLEVCRTNPPARSCGATGTFTAARALERQLRSARPLPGLSPARSAPAQRQLEPDGLRAVPVHSGRVRWRPGRLDRPAACSRSRPAYLRLPGAVRPGADWPHAPCVWGLAQGSQHDTGRLPIGADPDRALANSPDWLKQHLCRKICLHRGVNPDRNRILVLPCSTIGGFGPLRHSWRRKSRREPGQGSQQRRASTSQRGPGEKARYGAGGDRLWLQRAPDPASCLVFRG